MGVGILTKWYCPALLLYAEKYIPYGGTIMRKILFACALLFVAVMSANAQFFSVNLGDSKETVKTKMVKAGFWLYEDDGESRL